MSERPVQALTPVKPGADRSDFQAEGRDIGASLFRRLLERADSPDPPLAEAPAVRDVDPAALALREAEQLLAVSGERGGSLAPSSSSGADGSAPFRCQRTLRLTNHREVPAEGLLLELEAPACLRVDPATGDVGPFQDIDGNGTARILLSNPTEPLGPAESLRIKLRGAAEVRLQRWSWLHPGAGEGER